MKNKEDYFVDSWINKTTSGHSCAIYLFVLYLQMKNLQLKTDIMLYTNKNSYVLKVQFKWLLTRFKSILKISHSSYL